MRRASFFSFAVLAVVLALPSPGCTQRGTLSCETSRDCIQAGINGTCRPSPLSEELWCSFPDPECPPPSERWGILTGDGLATECVNGEAADAGIADGGADAGPPDAAPLVDYALRFGGVVDDGVVGIAPGPAGSVYAVGTFLGSMTIGAHVLTSSGESDFYVARLLTDGSVLWAKNFGGAGADHASAVATGSDGAVVVLAAFSDEVDFGGGPIDAGGPRDFLLLKLSATGDFVWARGYGASSAEDPTALAVNEAGDLFVTGRFAGTTDLGSGLLMSAGAEDIFLARYSGLDGTEQWSQKLGGNGSEHPVSIDVRGANVAITGTFTGQTNLGGGVQPNSGGAFVATYSSASGVYGWSRLIPVLDAFSPVAPSGAAVAVDGGAYICGRFSGTANFGAGVITSAGFGDAFVARFAASGSLIWLRQIGGTQLDDADGIAVTTDLGVVVTGTFKSMVDFGVRQMTAAGSDVFLVELSADNIPVEALSFGNAGDEYVKDVFASPMVTIAGGFSGTMNAGATDLTSAGGFDVFVIGRVLP